MKNLWIVEALAATAVYAAAALLDRYVLFARKISTYQYFLYNSAVGLFIAIAAMSIAKKEISFSGISLLGVIVGILFGVFTLLYFKTISNASPVSTAAFMQAVPVISTFASPIFFSQAASSNSAAAILLLCLGLSFISLIDRSSIQRVAPTMLPAVLILSIGYVLQRIVLAESSTLAVLAMNRVGNVIVSIVILSFYRLRKMTVRPVLPSQRLVLVLGSIAGETFAVIGLFLSIRSYRTGPFPDVSALLATLPVFVLAGAVLLSRFSKAKVWFVPELAHWSSLALTLIAATAIALAIYLISVK
jgi:drug/metabolite transporter (DMT)-like permease